MAPKLAALTVLLHMCTNSLNAQERTGAASQWSTTTVRPAVTRAVKRPNKGADDSRRAAPKANATAVQPPPAKADEPSGGASRLQGTGNVVSRDPTLAPEARSDHADNSGAGKWRSDYGATALEYCRNLSPIADEARAAYLQQTIAGLEQELAKKAELLEARIAEHKQWVARRQQLANQASGALVQMFARMRPEAAAQQVSAMEDTIAAALLLRLEPKAASALLSEMAPMKSARLTAIVAAAGDFKLSASPSAETDEARSSREARKAQ